MLEVEIIEKAQKGDETSFEYIINKYKPLVIGHARQFYLIGGSIEDLIQEGNLGLYKAILSYNETKNANFLTFATLCIKRQLQMAVRKANLPKNKLWGQFVELDAETEEMFGPTLSEDLPTPESIIIGKEIFNEVKNEINTKLSTLEKQILYHFLKGESYQEIAQNLMITTKSVDNGLNRLRKKLNHLNNI